MTLKPNESFPLAEAVTADPLLLADSRIDFATAALRHVAAHPEASKGLNAAVSANAEDDGFWVYDGDRAHPYRPYVVSNGILQIPVQGVLLNKFSYAFGRWATGYQYIERALARGLSDSNVRAIALIVDSPGGEVAGCFELADKIFAARGSKPIRAFATDHAFSAAYALASSAEMIVVSRSGGTGSVGVITAHADWSGAMEKYGIKVTLIYAGDHKADGNPYEALPEDVKTRIQERITRIYGVFVETVARNRGMGEDAVRATKALTYDAQDSIAVGFADRQGALDEEIVAYATEATQMENEQMTTYTQEQYDAAVASARTEGATTARAEGHAAGVKAERDRVSAIMGSDEAKKRPAAAQALADSGIEADAAISALGRMPEEKAQEQNPGSAGATGVIQTMDAQGGAGVGDGGKPKAEGDGPRDIFALAGMRAPAKK